MEFTITAQNGDSVKVEAENWLLALGKAMAFFQVELQAIPRLVCSAGADGSVFADDPAGGHSWMVRRIEPRIVVMAAAASPNLEELAYVEADTSVDEPDTGELAVPTPPALQMPESSSLHRAVEEEESLAERLFDLGMDLTTASTDEACQMCLDLVLEYVPAESGCVARGTLDDPALRFVAASGAWADELLGREQPFGDGIVGACFDSGMRVLLDDAEAGPFAPGERRCVLCVPILDSELTYGVIRLVNPREQPFTRAQIESVETVAETLAWALGARMG